MVRFPVCVFEPIHVIFSDGHCSHNWNVDFFAWRAIFTNGGDYWMERRKLPQKLAPAKICTKGFFIIFTIQWFLTSKAHLIKTESSFRKTTSKPQHSIWWPCLPGAAHWSFFWPHVQVSVESSKVCRLSHLSHGASKLIPYPKSISCTARLLRRASNNAWHGSTAEGTSLGSKNASQETEIYFPWSSKLNLEHEN